MSLLTDASLIVTPNAYKASKLYSVIPNTVLGDMNIARATTATRVNSAGLIESVAINVPRLDYTLGSCPSILVEPQRTNLLLYSEQLDNVNWQLFDTTITPNVTTSPDGNTTADKVIPSAVSSFKIIGQIFVTIALQPYTTTIYFKSAENTQAYIRFGGVTNSPYIIYDLPTQAIVSSLGLTSSSITSMGNGWYKVSATAIVSTVNTAITPMMLPSTGYTLGIQNLPVFTGNGTNGGFIWGAQLELGSSSTSYIPTTAATVTRNADVISKTGISSLIGQTQGTIYAEINNTLMTSYSTGYVMRIFADPSNEVWIRKEAGSNKYTAKWRANSVDVYTQSNISVLNGNNKIAIAYKTGDSAVYLNGTQIATSASTGAFSVAPSQIGIGSSSTADFFNDRIELATLFPTRLTNAQLATLTTL
jgi:hypothetical protein